LRAEKGRTTMTRIEKINEMLKNFDCSITLHHSYENEFETGIVTATVSLDSINYAIIAKTFKRQDVIMKLRFLEITDSNGNFLSEQALAKLQIKTETHQIEDKIYTKLAKLAESVHERII
jgi:hypothetical protein